MLLVEDDATLRRALARMLAPLFDVTAVPDASGALAQLDAGIEVILTDYEMPDMNGVELLAEVRARKADIYRALTSSGNVPDLPALKEASLVQSFLPKPISREALQRFHSMLIDRDPR